MLEDADVPVLLTTSALASRLPAGSFETVCLDRDWKAIEQEAADNFVDQ